MAGGRICVIGAGLSGLAATRALLAAGLEVECFERGSKVGGLWRYENDNGMSAAYASLVTNASSRRMQFPSFPAPRRYGDFPRHDQMAEYLESFATAHGLERAIRFSSTVARASPAAGGWRVELEDGSSAEYDGLVVATGLYRERNLPELAGEFAGDAIHSGAYRTPDPYVGRRVVVMGAGQSALDIASEIAGVAERTVLACRRAHHILPRYVFGRPFDHLDFELTAGSPLPMVRANVRGVLALARARPHRGPLPDPDHELFERWWPAVTTERIDRALAGGAIAYKPGIAELMGDRVRFGDGSEEAVDAIVFATGYRMSFPFLPEDVGRANESQFPLYRRIVSPRANALYFVGIVEPGPRIPRTIELQARWLASHLAGRIALPPADLMRLAIDAGEKRSRQMFGSRGPHTIFCDGHAYARLLQRDLRTAA